MVNLGRASVTSSPSVNPLAAFNKTRWQRLRVFSLGKAMENQQAGFGRSRPVPCWQTFPWRLKSSVSSHPRCLECGGESIGTTARPNHSAARGGGGLR